MYTPSTQIKMNRNEVARAPRYAEKERLLKSGLAGTKRDTLSRVGIVLAVILVAVMLGFTPMWLTSKGYKNQLDAVVNTLRPSVLQNDLATATINAHRGEYERARQQASSFFTDLSGEITRDESSFKTDQVGALEAILVQRDEIITLLARRDPEGAERLSNLYFQFTQLKNSAPPEISRKRN